jgi:hypothetical protein
MIEAAFKRIRSELKRVLNDEQDQWLASAFVKIGDSDNPLEDLLNLSAIARRKLGQEVLGSDVAPLQLDADQILPIQHWNYADAGRALLVLQAVSTAPEQAQSIIRNYFQQGDETEVAAITHILILFADGEALKFYAREAGRTNTKPLYAALAQYNPYPAKFYSSHEFNQLILKALFMGVGIDPVIGLIERANPELSQMCEDYIKERVAAGRRIPPDIWLALEPYASQEGEAMLAEHLADESPEHRYFAVKALLHNPGKANRKQLLGSRAQLETDPRIQALLASQ